MIRAVLRLEKSTFSIMRTRGSCEMHEVFFFVFIHEPLVRIKKKVLFSWFSNVFHHFQPCKRMRKHVFAGQNTSRVHCFVGGLSKKADSNYSLLLEVCFLEILRPFVTMCTPTFPFPHRKKTVFAFTAWKKLWVMLKSKLVQENMIPITQLLHSMVKQMKKEMV